MNLEESKWASRTESIKLCGKESELDSSTSMLRIEPQQLCEDETESFPVCNTSTPTSEYLLNIEDKTERNENQFTKSHVQPTVQIQSVGNMGQLHGITPVKLCRKELRQISAMELSLRRSGLGPGVGSITADSIEVDRKLHFKT